MSKRKRKPPEEQPQRGQSFIVLVSAVILFVILGMVGSTLSSHVSTTAAPSSPDQSVTVLTKALNVRAGPGTGYGIVHSLSKDEQVQVLGINDDRTWYRISHEASEGWVSADSKLVSFEGDRNLLAVIPNPTYIAPPKAAPARATSVGSGGSGGSSSTSAKNPGGATARCVDGTYSYSANHRGTCSHHGGVAQWFK